MTSNNCTIDDIPCAPHGLCDANLTCTCTYGFAHETGFVISSDAPSSYCFVVVGIERKIWFALFIEECIRLAVFLKSASSGGSLLRRFTSRDDSFLTKYGPINSVAISMFSQVYLVIGAGMLAFGRTNYAIGQDVLPTYLVFNHVACECILGVLYLVRYAGYFELMKKNHMRTVARSRRRCRLRTLHLQVAIPFQLVISNIVVLGTALGSPDINVIGCSLTTYQALGALIALQSLIYPIYAEQKVALGTAYEWNPATRQRLYTSYKRTRMLYQAGLLTCIYTIAIPIVSTSIPALRHNMGSLIASNILIAKLPRFVLGQKDNVFEMTSQQSIDIHSEYQYVKKSHLNIKKDLPSVVQRNIESVENFVQILEMSLLDEFIDNSIQTHSDTRLTNSNSVRAISALSTLRSPTQQRLNIPS